MLIKPAKADPYTPFWYQIEVDARGAEVQSPGGDTPLAGLDLILQKSQASTNTVLRTIVNVFETKQSPYRILIAFRAGVNPRFYQIAVADSLEELQRNLQYITDNIITGMRKLDEDDRDTIRDLFNRWKASWVNYFRGMTQAQKEDFISGLDKELTRRVTAMLVVYESSESPSDQSGAKLPSLPPEVMKGLAPK